jgi:ribose transport system permease protein
MSTKRPAQRSGTPKRRFGSSLKHSPAVVLERFGVPIAVIALIVIFSVLLPETFPTSANTQAILSSKAVVAMLSLAVMVPLVVGEFDLSLASGLGWLAMEFAALMSKTGVGAGGSIVIVLATGAAIGAFNAFLVLKLKISSFIATLAVGTVLVGASLAITGGTVISTGLSDAVISYGSASWGIPVLAWSVVGIGAVLWYVLRQTPTGRFMYATGGNRSASHLAGIRTTRIVTMAFIVGGILTAFAGIMSVAYAGSASPTNGPSLLLPAFAAAFLGATTIDVGRFNVIGTVLGVLLVGIGVAGLRQLGLSSYVAQFFNGGVLIAAVALARVGSASRRGKAVSGART